MMGGGCCALGAVWFPRSTLSGRCFANLRRDETYDVRKSSAPSRTQLHVRRDAVPTDLHRDAALVGFFRNAVSADWYMDVAHDVPSVNQTWTTRVRSL